MIPIGTQVQITGTVVDRLPVGDGWDVKVELENGFALCVHERFAQPVVVPKAAKKKALPGPPENRALETAPETRRKAAARPVNEVEAL